MKRKTPLLASFAAILGIGVAPPLKAADVSVTANITADTTWTANNDYLLDRPIYVTNGATLTIQPGTTIYGSENLDNDTFGSLVITRGCKINAVGTSAAPIVFTALDERDFGPLTLDDTSLWGGVILLGRAILNDAGNPFLGGNVLNERLIEGFPSGGNDDLITYGGLDDSDDSGVMRFVSIRYGGFKFDADNEINGLTLGAVGDATDLSFIEVFNNSDDGVEFFGGTVDTSHMVMAFNEDEAFDIDQGYRGRGQFWFAIQKDGGADGLGTGSNFGGEHDGGDSPDKTLEPFARSKVFNATHIGAGASAPDYGQDNGAFRLKDNFAGQYHNSTFHDFLDEAMRIDDQDTRDRANSAGDLSFENNTWGAFGSSDGTAASLTKNGSAEEIAQLNTKGNEIADPRLRGISRSTSGGLDPRPAPRQPALEPPRSARVPDDGFYAVTNHRGAFGHDNWLEGCDQLDSLGYLSEPGRVTDRHASDGQHHDRYHLDRRTAATCSTSRSTSPTAPRSPSSRAPRSTAPRTSTTTPSARSSSPAAARSTPPAPPPRRSSSPPSTSATSARSPSTTPPCGAASSSSGAPSSTMPATPSSAATSSTSASSRASPPAATTTSSPTAASTTPTTPASCASSRSATAASSSTPTTRSTASPSAPSATPPTSPSSRSSTTPTTASSSSAAPSTPATWSWPSTRTRPSTSTRATAAADSSGSPSRRTAAPTDSAPAPTSAASTTAATARTRPSSPSPGPRSSTPPSSARAPRHPTTARTTAPSGSRTTSPDSTHNSTFHDFLDEAMRIDDQDTRDRANSAGDLSFENNTWGAFGSSNGTATSLTKNGSAEEIAQLNTKGNEIADPRLRGISRSTSGGLDPRPDLDSPLWTRPAQRGPR